MTDREKLVYLIKENAKAIVSSTENGVCVCLDVEALADHLLDHGVTVKETKKLLKRGLLLTNSPGWIEIRYGDGFFDLEPAEITKGTGANYYIYRIGAETPTRLDGKEYGKWWRFWTEKPTEEERKAAEWEN